MGLALLQKIPVMAAYEFGFYFEHGQTVDAASVTSARASQFMLSRKAPRGARDPFV